MRILPVLFLSAAALLVAAAREPERDCSGPEYRQFDFVIGNWIVRDDADHAAATVTVSKGYDGCLLIEKWRAAGSAGESLGVIWYSAELGRWQREFLDRDGVVLTFEGSLQDVSMVLTGKDYTPDGVRSNRVTWSPRSDGAVEQYWQTSIDSGRTWQLHFYGVLYRIAE